MFGPDSDDQDLPVNHIGHPIDQTWRVLLTLERYNVEI